MHRAARRDDAPAPDALPLWFEHLFVIALLGYLAFAVTAVAAALLGAFRPPVLLLAAPVATGLVAAWRPGSRSSGRRVVTRRSDAVAAGLALLLILCVTAVNARHAGQHLVVDNDPGVYATTAQDVADDGDLLVETHPDVFGDAPGVSYAGAGYYPTAPDDSLYPQFAHLLPLTLAVGDWLGGPTLLLRTNAVLGGFALLCFFALAARVVRPWWGLLATAVLAVNFPQVYFSRDTFSEVLSQALLMGGLGLLWRARETGPPTSRGLLAGATLGAATMTRVDAYIYLAPLVLWAGWELLHGRPWGHGATRGARVAVGALVGSAVTAALAYVEVRTFSPLYLRDLAPQVRLSLRAVAASVLLVGVALTFRRTAQRVVGWCRTHGRAVAVVGAASVVIVAALAWFVRPSVTTATQTQDYNVASVAGLQRLEGVPVNGTRTYAEHSVRWLQWYLGPVALAAGFGGVALLVWRLLRGRAGQLLPLLLVAAPSAYYIYRPSITPIHIFADRRFVPVVFPTLILCAVALCAALWGVEGRIRPALRAIAVVIASCAIGVPAQQLAQMPDVRHGVPLLAAVRTTCAALADDAAVLLLGGLRNAVPVTIAAHCDVPVASAPDDVSLALVHRVRDAVADSGRRLVVLVDDPSLLPAGIGPPTPVVNALYTRLEPSLTRRPTHFRRSARFVVHKVEL